MYDVRLVAWCQSANVATKVAAFQGHLDLVVAMGGSRVSGARAGRWGPHTTRFVWEHGLVIAVGTMSTRCAPAVRGLWA